jgi:transcriptional regulator with XRE-family HTH domain
MTSNTLKQARRQARWTQARLAQTLGVTQAYLSLMETGKRRVPDGVARRVASLFSLPATVLPLPAPKEVERMATDAKVEEELARLGYPGLAYRRKPGKVCNPSALLLAALSLSHLDSRLVEALPWLLLHFEGWDAQTLVTRAKMLDLQNRLGFTAALAREVAEGNPMYRHRTDNLRRLEEALDVSRLAREDTFGRGEESERMRAWVRDHRSGSAKHWNLLTDLKVEHLHYAGRNP